VADLVFGKASPSGKLPITFPKSLDQLPAYESYAMQGRTYRYMTAEPLYPFGFGLSYATFEYPSVTLSTKKVAKGKPLEVAAVVRNTGKMAGEEVVQLYLTHPPRAGQQVPLFALKHFRRVRLEPGASTTVKFTLTPEELALIDAKGNSVAVAGAITVSVGGSLPSKRSQTLGASAPAVATVVIK